MGKIVIANWKMALGHKQSSELATALRDIRHSQTFVICPSSLYLLEMAEILKDSAVALGAQDCASRNTAAFTGGISAAQLAEVGCKYCIVGHSERRMYAHETGREIHDKIAQLLEESIVPVVCVGEDMISHKSGEAAEVISTQLDEIGFNIDWKRVIVAYEPIWAIGSGQTPSAAEIAVVAEIISNQVAPRAVLYGGSVSNGNALELSGVPHIDGFLIGSASTKFAEIQGILTRI